MDSLYSTMNQRIKGKHLSFEEWVIIQTRIKNGFSLRAIARELSCSPSTISYEVKRGTVSIYHGKQRRYKADHGQSVFQANRYHCGRKSALLKKSDFIEYVNKHFSEDDWSLDVCANRSLAIGEFSSNQTVCTRTLYNYVDQGLMDSRNCDLPEKLNATLKFIASAKIRESLVEALKNFHKRSTIEKSSAIGNTTWF